MVRRVVLGVVCGLMVASLWAAPASAQAPNGGYAGTGSNGSLGFYGFGYYDYSSANPARIPYYALYPPVYYSYPVARPYGFSPFAYPPGVLTPELAPKAAATTYQNPFVPQPSGKDTETASDKTASTARTFYNPFVQQANAAGARKQFGQ